MEISRRAFGAFTLGSAAMTGLAPLSNTDSAQGHLAGAIGKELPPWRAGYLDIHAVNTGRGESTLCVLPDGTTLLIDAAGSLLPASDPIPPTDPRPSGEVTSGQVIANYVHWVLRQTGSPKLNYLMLSHFHPDHMGNYTEDLPMAPDGDFRMTGITEVGAKVPFETIIDRGHPNYDYPEDLTTTRTFENYLKFIEWAMASQSATAEQIEVGARDQIALRRSPSRYRNFQIRNVVGNGRVWTGDGTNSRNTFPAPDDLLAAGASENIFSIGLQMSYGRFRYFCGGDLQYGGVSEEHPWKDIETPVAEVLTAVDSMKANHHGTTNCNGTLFVNQLSPKNIIVHTWRDIHPNPETLERFITANNECNIFTTNLTPANRERLGEDLLARMPSTQGHVVLRVYPGGARYNIYTLDDRNERYLVIGAHGPYLSEAGEERLGGGVIETLAG